MHAYGYSPGPGGDWFPDSQGRLEQDLVDARKAKENAPTKVLSEMAVVFGTSLAVVLLIDLAVFLASAAI
jgi:hypothetical protein